MLSRFRALWLGLAAASLIFGQNTGDLDFTTAYQALAQKNYDSAIDLFRAGLRKQPGSPGVHKDLAYTLLQIGENAAARDEFEVALTLNRQDEQAALEYAFLAYETGKRGEAKVTFDRLRKSGSSATRKVAEQAFANIDDQPVVEQHQTGDPVLSRALGSSTDSSSADSNGWSKILAAVGLTLPSISSSGVTILQGNIPAAEQLGIHADAATVSVRQISDIHNPKMQISWNHAETVQETQIPPGFQVFAREKSTGSPVLAGRRTDTGAVLWIATPPGKEGFERYPYILQALMDLGLAFPSRDANLWAFFDSAYRSRADVDYLAQRWRNAGISALHVATWHNMEPDAAADDYLARLIEACHRHAIVVYAWLELPFVSEKFWADHPGWRDKTATGQDAQIGWRKLMNLQNSECSHAAAGEIKHLIEHFDWDGINLSELAFESREDASDPARFTPMNDNVRAEFHEIADFDPKFIFDSGSPRANKKDLRTFLDFRAVLASRLQSEWLKTLQSYRLSKPYLDIVLTHNSSPTVIDEVGGKNIAVDLSFLDRDSDALPTPKQTGVELLQSVHAAAYSFPRVAFYAESSVERVDLPLISAAAATARINQQGPNSVEFEDSRQSRLEWNGLVAVDSKPWPLRNDHYLILPAGRHRITASTDHPPLTITDFNGEIQSATTMTSEIDVAYQSRTRALVSFDQNVGSVEVDGASVWKASDASGPRTVVLPAGQHLATFNRR